MKKLLLFITYIPFAICCNDNVSVIKKDLNYRFTKVEIIEIRPDSANIYTASNTLRSLRMRTATANLEIIRTLGKILDEPGNEHKLYLHADSVSNNLSKDFEYFDNTRFSRPDECYYIKYLIVGPEIKTEKEEYYHLRLMGNGDYDIIHRPYDWEEYMYSKEYSKMIQEALKYHSELFQLEQKYSDRK